MGYGDGSWDIGVDYGISEWTIGYQSGPWDTIVSHWISEWTMGYHSEPLDTRTDCQIHTDHHTPTNTPHRTKQKTKPLLRERVVQLQTPHVSEGNHQPHAVALQRAAPRLLQVYETVPPRPLRSFRFQIEPMFQNTCPRIPDAFKTTGKLTAAPTARQRSPPSTSPSGFPPSTCHAAGFPTLRSRPRSDIRGFKSADVLSR